MVWLDVSSFPRNSLNLRLSISLLRIPSEKKGYSHILGEQRRLGTIGLLANPAATRFTEEERQRRQLFVKRLELPIYAPVPNGTVVT